MGVERMAFDHRRSVVHVRKAPRHGPTAVLLPKRTAGLRHQSVALCHQVTTLDRSKLTGRIGELPTSALKRVNEGLRAALALL
jgi:mRNA interferase MazF